MIYNYDVSYVLYMANMGIDLDFLLVIPLTLLICVTSPLTLFLAMSLTWESCVTLNSLLKCVPSPLTFVVGP
jgi:hypothetical protein